MKRIGTILIVAAVVATLLAIPLGVSAATDNGDDSQQATPGEQLGGVVGVQAAAVDGELDDRTFGQQIANADSDEARADLIKERLNQTERRIADQQDSIDELQERREAGEISEGRYQAQLARLEAERANTERGIERANNTARGLPADVLAERGVTVDRINELRTNARQLGGPETGEAAREIAGQNVTTPVAGDRPSGDRIAGDRGAENERSGSDRSTTDRDQPSTDRGDDRYGENSDTDRESSRTGSDRADSDQESESTESRSGGTE